MIERTHSMVIRVSHEELARLHRIANAQDREIARVVRSWIKTTYEDKWGTEAPPAPKLKHTKKKAA